MESVADQLMALKATPLLIRAAKAGRITELRCAMDECYCPRGRGYFELAGGDWPDWRPTNDRLCNRVDYSKLADRPYARDLARVEAARRAWFPFADAS